MSERYEQAAAEADRITLYSEDRNYRHLFMEGVEWADANPKPADGSTSDGHHTFNELYEYRMLYNAHAAHGWLAAGIPVVKSWRHADGEECFGGGWFIVTASLPAGQVSNHYEARHWGLFKVPEVDVPPEWDGHTPHDAAMRLRIEAEHANPYSTPEALVAAYEDGQRDAVEKGLARVRITADQCNDIEDAVHEGVPLGHMLRRLGIEVVDDE